MRQATSSPLCKLAKSRMASAVLEKSADLNFIDSLRLGGYRAIPGALFPEARGKIVMDAYVSNAEKAIKKGKKPPQYVSELGEKAMRTPGTSASIAAYLNGSGRHLIPKIVEQQLGDQWYTGAAKLLSRTPFGRSFVIDKILEKTLPKMYGSTDIARMYMQAGGVV